VVNGLGVYFKMFKVYIAGALNSDAVGYLKNCSRMMEYAEKVRKSGHSVFIPCLDLLMGLKFGYDRYEDYFNNSIPWLLSSDAIFVCPKSEKSSGTTREIFLATEKRIPVFWNVKKLNSYFAKKRKK
jgi:hypothetical protein